MLRQISFAVVVIACSFAVISAITCYDCNSYSDVNGTACIDPLTPTVDNITCPDTFVCTRVSFITQKQFIVTRSCDPGTDTCNRINKSLSLYYPDLALFNCYACTGDYCNAASGVDFSTKLA